MSELSALAGSEGYGARDDEDEVWRLVGGILPHWRRFVQGILPEVVTALGAAAKGVSWSADQTAAMLAAAGDRKTYRGGRGGLLIEKLAASEGPNG